MKGKHIALGAVLLVGAGAVGLKTYAGGVADEKISAAIAEMKLEKSVSYDSVSVGLFGSVTIDGLKFGQHGEVTVDELTISSLDQDSLAKAEFPTYGDIEAEGITLNMSEKQLKRSYPALYNLGYRKITGAMAIDFSYDDNKLNLSDVTVALDDVGSLSGSLDMGVKVGKLNNLFQLLGALDNARVEMVELAFDNDGILDAIENKEEGAIAAIVKNLEEELANTASTTEKMYLEAVRDFVEGGDYLKVSANPEKALRLTYVMKLISHKAIGRLAKEGNLTFEGA